MTKLIKADFRRVFKDKLVLIMAIIAAVFSFITPVLYAVLFGSSQSLSELGIENFVTAKSQFFQSFSIGNNMGLIAPVLLCIVLWKDFSYGTVRNKIIAGNSRTSIFMSLFTVCSAVTLGVMFLHAFLTLGISLVFFDYQAGDFTANDFGYFMISLLFEVIVLLFISAMLSWLCASMKNLGLVIVLYDAISFVLVMVGSIVTVIAEIMSFTPGNEQTVEVLDIISRINVGNSTLYIGTGDSYTLKDVLYIVLPPLAGIAGFLGLGLINFNKKDLK